MSPRTKETPALAAHGKEPVVGGCLLLCTTPEKAFANLIAILNDQPVGKTGVRIRGRDNSAPTSARVFINTSELISDGHSISAPWNKLWLEKKNRQRFSQIDAWVLRLKEKWRASAPAEAQATIRPQKKPVLVEKTAHSAIFTYAQNIDRAWTFQFHRRGVEWLLSRIKMKP